MTARLTGTTRKQHVDDTAGALGARLDRSYGQFGV
jgi:hypothetical protein